MSLRFIAQYLLITILVVSSLGSSDESRSLESYEDSDEIINPYYHHPKNLEIPIYSQSTISPEPVDQLPYDQNEEYFNEHQDESYDPAPELPPTSINGQPVYAMAAIAPYRRCPSGQVMSGRGRCVGRWHG